MTPTAVLVTDGHLRSSLAVVRSLGRAGHTVFVCSPRRRSLAGVSRYAAAESRVPDPLSQPDAFADAIVALVRDKGVSVLLPMSDESLTVVLQSAPLFRGIQIPFASHDAFQNAADKAYVTQLAASLDIAVPEQVLLTARPRDARVHLGAVRFPVVLKPARSVNNGAAGREKLGVSYASDEPALVRALAELPDAAFPLLLQQRIEGPGTGVFLLMWNGRLVAQFAHARIREKPPSGGVSVIAESIDADPKTVNQSRALLDALQWRGPAMIEFKQDRATGRMYLMEINGRFWGSLQLAIDAGVDFPALLIAAALGRDPQPVTRYSIGVRTRWWWGEVDHLIARLRGDTSGYGARGRWNALRSFVAPGRNVKNEVLRIDDPRPFVRESLDWIRGR